MDFNPGYSLVGIVIDQAHMFARQGHRVIIYVSEQYNPQFENDMGLDVLLAKYENIIVKRMTRFMHLKDYTSAKDLTDEHKALAKEASEAFAGDFIAENVKHILTHDFIFTGWNLPYSEAVKLTSNSLIQQGKAVKWYHWVHSVPSQGKDWWDLNSYGLNHNIVFPNKTEIMRVAESFKTTANRVTVIPHIKDMRNWYDFGEGSMQILDQYPAIIKAELIQVYPCSTDRMSAKQLDVVMKMFAHMKLSGQKNVFLIIANQWATGRARREDVDKYIEMGENIGLIPGKDFCFTSKTPGMEKGISKRTLRELQLLSDIFIFPTREESFGLVGPEASFSGALPIINKSLTMMYEVMGHQCPAYEFGSFHNNVPSIKDDNYIRAVAIAVLNRVYADESVMTKALCRLKYNMDNIYTNYYLPITGPSVM